MTHRRSLGGFTLVEILIAMTVASVLLLAGYALLNMAGTVYQRISGHEDAALQLKKAARVMQKDLLASNILGVSSTLVSGTAGPGGYGCDAVRMLSSASGDNAKGPVCTTDTGEPFWQRNVLYYTVRPLGDACSGGADSDGYEDMCPHKVLIRKVIDSNPATTPDGTPADVKEAALGNFDAYLTRPNQNSVSSMLGEPQVTSTEIAAVNLLTMRVKLNPDPKAPGEVLVTYKAFNEPSARKGTNIGSVLLGNHEKTLTYVLSAFPRNTI